MWKLLRVGFKEGVLRVINWVFKEKKENNGSWGHSFPFRGGFFLQRGGCQPWSSWMSVSLFGLVFLIPSKSQGQLSDSLFCVSYRNGKYFASWFVSICSSFCYDMLQLSNSCIWHLKYALFSWDMIRCSNLVVAGIYKRMSASQDMIPGEAISSEQSDHYSRRIIRRDESNRGKPLGFFAANLFDEYMAKKVLFPMVYSPSFCSGKKRTIV